MVHPRTLELLRPLGISDALLARGRPLREVTLHTGRRTVHLRLPALATSDTPYRGLYLLAQADIESVLRQHLARRGIDVEWGVRLTGGLDGTSDAAAEVDSGRPIRARYVVGCDGADSSVRSVAGIDVRGGSYRSTVTLADVELAGDLPAEGLPVFVGRRGMAFIGNVGEYAPWRVLATDPSAVGAVELSASSGLLGRACAAAVKIRSRSRSSCAGGGDITPATRL